MEGTPFGRYRLIELLGQGGMGEVWKAHDTAIDRVVALKMLLPHYAKDPDFERRFRREARAAARLDDPHVVPIYDVGEIDDRLYVTMRLINGRDLQSMIHTGPLEPQRAVAIIDQIASALHNAHRVGLVHRDVKPSNILVDGNDYAYLIDFGIARAATDTRLTSASSAIGTWAYMAPERFNSGDVHPSSDIYALACVLYQCLTGQQPFPGSTLEQVAVGHMVTPPPRPSERAPIPPAMDRVIATGLAKQPADRYPTAVEMASAAKEAVTGSGSSSAWAAPAPAPSPGALSWPEQPFTQIGNTPAPYPASAPTQFSGPHHFHQQHPQDPKKSAGSRHGILVGALVFVVTLVVVAGAVGVVAFTQRDRSAASAPPASSVNSSDFTGNYRADYGPGTDLGDTPVPNAPATTNSWNVRSECGAGGCVATAASAGGNALLSNMTFDQLGGTWVAVGLASAQCGTPDPVEIWVIMTLQPQPDGTLAGESIRASTNSACAAKRAAKFTRTGDPDLNKVASPAVLPPRTLSPAEGLHGSYRQTTTLTDGNVLPGKVLQTDTYCLRTGNRCMSLFHAGAEVVTLMFADDKWTRNEQGTSTCPAGTAQVTITAEYPMPQTLDDPISVLTGRGKQTIAPGGPCTGGGDFQDRFERTGD
ncbi:serine/threonine-protein kinase [Mycobacterium sp. 1274761.0]|uniref:serine/threonine-protein kinase n=1 Tax=Mycobacterium sp. 1274761.0 TaxID=1834077 RepID=UPI0007FCC054|nr:serine/threonine protein kinase [Mycobacterium sp. 1274761.0]